MTLIKYLRIGMVERRCGPSSACPRNMTLKISSMPLTQFIIALALGGLSQVMPAVADDEKRPDPPTRPRPEGMAPT